MASQSKVASAIPYDEVDQFHEDSVQNALAALALVLAFALTPWLTWATTRRVAPIGLMVYSRVGPRRRIRLMDAPR